MTSLKQKAQAMRRQVVCLISSAQTGHVGGSLSSMDILVALYYRVLRYQSANPEWSDRDRFVLSKGHCVEALYVILNDLGFISAEELATFGQYGTRLIGHTNKHVPAIEHSTGSLGHGLSVAVGMALGAKMCQKDAHIYVLLGDGEQGEGSVWEAALSGSHHRLGNLTAIVDRNQLQISGPTEETLRLEPLVDKWRAFGWQVTETDGHDFSQLVPALIGGRINADQPNLVIAHTEKGKGVPFMEGDVGWHHRVPSSEQLKEALLHLDIDACDGT